MFLRVGLDLDNTIVDYRPLFASAARRLELGVDLGTGSKEEVRDRLRARSGGEEQWQRLQAHVYGVAIADAQTYPGFDAFFRELLERDTFVAIVSHKTQFAAAAPTGPDLRAAALRWLVTRGIVGSGGIDPANVYFEGTRRAKLERIGALALTHFVDDLPEVLDNPSFPAGIERIRFWDSWAPIRALLTAQPA